MPRIPGAFGGAGGGSERCLANALEEVFEGFEGTDDPDITMYGTTLLMYFAELVRQVPIDTIMKVQHKYPGIRHGKVSHIVVVGPDGFQLCTFLKLMRCGLNCCHVLAALVTRLGRAKDFVGASIHPRWRSSLGEWSLRNTKLAVFERGTFAGGVADDFGSADIGPDLGADSEGDGGRGTRSKDLAYARGKMYADYVAVSMKWAGAASAKESRWEPGVVASF